VAQFRSCRLRRPPGVDEYVRSRIATTVTTCRRSTMSRPSAADASTCSRAPFLDRTVGQPRRCPDRPESSRWPCCLVSSMRVLSLSMRARRQPIAPSSADMTCGLRIMSSRNSPRPPVSAPAPCSRTCARTSGTRSHARVRKPPPMSGAAWPCLRIAGHAADKDHIGPLDLPAWRRSTPTPRAGPSITCSSSRSLRCAGAVRTGA